MVRTTLGHLQSEGVIQFSDGYRTKQSEHGPGLRILRVREVDDGCVRVGTSESVREEFKSRMGAKVSSPGDVLVTTKGSVGRVARIPEGFPPHVYSPQLCFVRVIDSTRIDPGWLYGWMRSPLFAEQLETYAHQTDMAPYLSLGDLQRFGLDLPPLDVQRRIAGVLGTLDDLIEIDTDLAARNLALARAAVARSVNSGAVIRKVEEVAEFENRKRVPLSAEQRAAMPGPFPYYGAAGPLGTVGRFLFDGHRVLVGEDGTVVRDAGAPVVQSVWGRYWVNNHAHVLAGVGISNDLLRLVLLASDVSSLITGAVQPKLSMGNLKAAKVAIPSDPGIDTQVQLLGHAERSLLDEAGELRRIRDELLPLLMSGHVTPREVA